MVRELTLKNPSEEKLPISELMTYIWKFTIWSNIDPSWTALPKSCEAYHKKLSSRNIQEQLFHKRKLFKKPHYFIFQFQQPHKMYLPARAVSHGCFEQILQRVLDGFLHTAWRQKGQWQLFWLRRWWKTTVEHKLISLELQNMDFLSKSSDTQQLCDVSKRTTALESFLWTTKPLNLMNSVIFFPEEMRC